MTNQLIISNTIIPTDQENRIKLNSLHKASGLGKHKSPNKWLANQSTLELIQELDNQTPNSGSALKVSNGGKNSGTFAHKLLAISYAGWISPQFQLHVNQVFLDNQTLKNNEQLNLPDLEEFKAEKYALINAMIQQMKLPDEPLVIPYVDLANMVNTSRHIEQQTLMLIKVCKNIDARIDDFKKYTGRHLCDIAH